MSVEGPKAPAAPKSVDKTPGQLPEEAAPNTTLQEVTVTAQRQVNEVQAGPLGNRTILETPFSVGQVDTEQITRTAATTIDGAFNYDASTRPNNSGVASGNTFSVRGQAVDLTNGYKYDGLAFPYWYQDQPIEAMSEIQILKGAGGFVYGYASPSGVVNFVSKKPTREFRSSANLSLRSSSMVRVHLDVGGPLRDGDSTAFRLNAVHEEGTLYNGAYNRNQFVTLWVQGDIIPQLSWSADGFYQRTWQERQSNSISLGPKVTSLKPVSGELNLGAPSTTKWNDVAQVTGRLNYRITPNWQASLALRTSTLDERFPGNTIQVMSNAGDYNSGLLNQNRLFFYYVAQATIDGRFDTGPVAHNVVAGFDYLDVNFDYDYQPYTANGRPTTSYGFKQTGNLYSEVVPDWGNDPSALKFQRPPAWFRYQEIRQRGLFLSDTLKLGHAELLAGLRYTTYDESNAEPVLAATKYSESPVTPVAALSYDLFEGARVYASYVQALQRGELAPQNALNPGESLGPLRSTQYEAGAKVHRKAWGATLAGFYTTVPSDFLAAPANGEALGRWVRDGERRFQGIEFEGNLRPNGEWLLNVSTAYLDARQSKASTPDLVGKRVPGTTNFQASGFVQYSPSFFPGARLFGGIRHVGKAYGQATNTFTFSPATVGDAGVGYSISLDKSELQLQANVQNVTNEWYWVSNSAGTGLSAGAPRTFSLSVGLVTGGSESAASGSAGPASSSGDSAGSAGASPDGSRHWYIGLDAGVAALAGTNFDVKSRVDPGLGRTNDGLELKHRAGWAIGGTLGYDFGLFRSELEFTQEKTTLNQVKLSSPVPIDASGRPAGTYGNPGGYTLLTTFLFNGLLDVGGTAQMPWALQAGVGLGLARVNARWKLDNAVDTAFQVDNPTNFAWQVLAGVRRRLTDRIDLTLKYRLLNLPGVKLFTANANEIDGNLQSHSVLAGTSVNF